MKFLDQYPEETKNKITDEIKTIWTHSSTALEGNTLSLGETKKVIAGLTISGHTLVEHREIFNHVRALDLILDQVENHIPIDLCFLNKLNFAVQNQQVIDSQNPVGRLKNSINGVRTVKNSKLNWTEFSSPELTPHFLAQWIELINKSKVETPEEAIDTFSKLHIAFTCIHPYSDGNGRMARLLSNIPLLRAGFPPILIDNKQREEYIQVLSGYSDSGGIPRVVGDPILREGNSFNKFKEFVQTSGREVYKILFKYQQELSRSKKREPKNSDLNIQHRV